MGTFPYDAAGHGRRGSAWNPPRLGENTLLYSHGLELLARSRDAMRNSAYASGAIDAYVSNAIGRGIRPMFLHPDEKVRTLLATKWKRWIKESDVEYEVANAGSGITDFYGKQALIAREAMEAGELFIRFRPRPRSEGLTVPLQLQLLQSEQLPLWRMTLEKLPEGNTVRCGIEYGPDDRRKAYHFWKAHPGETMFFPMDGLQVERVPARDILHVFKPIFAGQMRGRPWLTPVLAKLYEIEKLQDAELVRRTTASMITGFITQVSPAGNILPNDPRSKQPAKPQTQVSKFEPGSFPVLYPGEDITLAQTPDSGDLVPVLKSCLRAFAAGVGILYEHLGDLEGVSYSSIRSGLLEFRRKCEQFQHGVFVYQVCQPILCRWLQEGMLALSFGADLLDQYLENPAPFEECEWVTPGWPWVDPEKDIRAAERAIRDGLSSRSIECEAQGRSSVAIDAQQEADNARADQKGLSYDSDGRKVLTGRNAGMTETEIEDGAEVAGSTGAKR
jgi:lambda family phage portal protein